jgi:hypothetical protein
MTNDLAEDKPTRLDRELNELLQELRVLLPGVQVLFAFLLTVPFAAGFVDTTDSERAIYFVAFALTTLSAILLVAPSVRHRGRFRERDKEALIASSNRLALGGTVTLATAIATAGLLIGEILYGWLAGIATAIGALLLAAWFWYGWSAQRALERDPR